MAFTLSANRFHIKFKTTVNGKMYPMSFCPDFLFEAIKFYEYSLKHIYFDVKTNECFQFPVSVNKRYFDMAPDSHLKCAKIECLFTCFIIYHSVNCHPFLFLAWVLSVCSLQFFIQSPFDKFAVIFQKCQHFTYMKMNKKLRPPVEKLKIVT